MALARDPIFQALTRPQMFAGVSYSFFVLNLVVTMEVFLLSKSFWAIGAAGLVHMAAYALCRREPRILDLWLLRAQKCPRPPDFKQWRCNSYAP